MINSQITLKQVEAFVSVVDTGSFRRAAAALGTTQPNVSNRIATLEKLLGTVLMHRDAGSVKLTQAGTELMPQARKILRSVETFVEVSNRKDLIEDRFRLGVTELIACTWLQTFLRAFRQEYPSIIVELQVDLSSEIDRRLTAGELDLALQTGDFEDDVCTSLKLGSYEYCWTAIPEIASALSANPDLNELLEYSVLTHAKHTSAGREISAFCRKISVPTNRIVHSSSLYTCLPMALDGMGVALLPVHLVKQNIDSGELVIVNCDWLPSELKFFARFDHRRTPNYVAQAARKAVEIAQQNGG